MHTMALYAKLLTKAASIHYAPMNADPGVFRNHPDACIVRYGKIYGPYNLLPSLWMVVKRVLDGAQFV